jgi:hypothetical protein
LLAEKEVLGSKYGARRGQGLQKANTVGEAINKDREEGCKEREEARDLAQECSGLRNPTGFEQLTRTSELPSNGSNWHRTEYLRTTAGKLHVYPRQRFPCCSFRLFRANFLGK